MSQISAQAEEALYDLFYNKGYYFGRDKLYALAKSHGIKVSRRAVMEWLRKQMVRQVYAPTNLTKNIQRTVLKRPHAQIGIDIVDMQNFEYNGYNYILTGYDLFSKKAYARPLKGKSEASVVKAMEDMIKKDIITVSSIRSDNGSEFISAKFKALLKKHHISQVFSLPSKPQSNGGIERFNRTLKRLIRVGLKIKQTENWVSQLPTLIKNYNTVKNDVTKSTPDALDSGNKEALKDAHGRIAHKAKNKRQNTAQKFEVGDKVRLKLDKEDRPKSAETFSKQVYTVYRVFKPRSAIASWAYYVKTPTKSLTKKYYTNDLLFIPAVHNEIDEPEKFEISKIVRPLIHNKVPSYMIRWKGYSERENTIEPRSELIKDAPKLVKAFDNKHDVVFYKTKVVWEE